MIKVFKGILFSSVVVLGTTGCKLKDIQDTAGVDKDRYEAVKIREQYEQIEFWILDKKTGEICAAVSRYKEPTTDGSMTFTQCIENRFKASHNSPDNPSVKK